MGWDTIAQLIITEGVPLAMSLFKKWTSGTPPTLADFEELAALSQRRASDEMADAIRAAGIDPDSQRAKDLKALTNG